jgi:2-oxo-hept-3-ene-1,7-dioate hydratase
MSLSDADLRRAAEDLLCAEATGRQIGLLSMRHPDLDMDSAYDIQKALIEAKLAAGRRVIGWKIGLTSRAMQDALNIDVPDSGVLLDDMIFASGSTVPRGRFIQPRVEAEIAFVMRAPLAGVDITRDEVLAATGHVAPAVEILDTRILRRDPETGAPRKIVDTISDNAANAGIVLGDERHEPASVDMRWVGAIVTRDGEVEETGLGAGVLNDPVTGILWLVHRLAAYGRGIAAGEVLLSGSFIRPIEAPPGSRFHADFGAFGSASLNF